MTYYGTGQNDRIQKLVSVSGERISFKDNDIQNVITVAKNGAGDFTSVKAAVESINDAVAQTNEYDVIVGPGFYTEQPFIVSTGINLIGSPGSHLSTLNDYSNFITIQGSTRIDVKDVAISGPKVAGAAICCDGGIVTLSNLSIQNCAIGVEVSSNNTFCVANDINFNNLNHPSGTYGTGVLVRENNIPGISNGFSSCTFVNTEIGAEILGASTSLMASVGRSCNTNILVSSGSLSIQGYNSTLSGTGVYSLGAGIVTGFGYTSDASTELDIKQEGNGRLSLVAASFSRSKVEIEDFHKISLFFNSSESEADKGVSVVGGQLSVGVAEHGTETVLGEGDSYSRGMIVYSSGVGSGALTDITVNVAIDGDGLTSAFPGTSIGDAIYMASSLSNEHEGLIKHHGFKLLTTTLADYGPAKAFNVQLCSSTGWIDCEYMTTEATGSYRPACSQVFKTHSVEHVRYNINKINEDWEATDIDGAGTSKFWSRVILQSGISTAPVLDQIKLHSSRSEFNADGYLEYFGNARPFGTIQYDLGLLAPAAASPGNQDIYLSDNLDVGRTENLFQNNAVDRIGFCAFAPSDMDTSCPIEMTFAWFTNSSNADAAQITIRWGYVTNGGDIYPSQAAAPTQGPNELSITASVPTPGAANVLQMLKARLRFDSIIASKEYPQVGDLIFISIERDGPSDAHTGNITLVQMVPRYTRFSDGGHI